MNLAERLTLSTRDSAEDLARRLRIITYATQKLHGHIAAQSLLDMELRKKIETCLFYIEDALK